MKYKYKYYNYKLIDDYIKNTFTSKNYIEISKDLNEKEIDAIRKGILVVGMSKKTILISYGYRPEIYTRSMNNKVWTYNMYGRKKTNPL